MPLQPYQLAPNSPVSVGGSEGKVVQTDNHLTYVSREDGKVDVYTTEYIVENGEAVQTEADKQQQQSDTDEAATLRARLAELEAQQVAAPGPAAVSEQTPAAPANPDPAAPANADGRQQTP